MILSSIRIITADIQRLVKFYETATGVAFTWFTEDFAELKTAAAALAIGSTRTLAFFGDNVAAAASNKSVIIEFRVDDVDTAYTRIPAETVVQQPTTMPWGNRSLLFRDPDGNLVNFFTPVTADAKNRFDVAE
jgi:predicted enzyme related to lactoylglutathione lyase